MLSLAGTELDHYPIGLNALTHLADLVLDDNQIGHVPPDATPRSVRRVSLVGNELKAVPGALLGLPKLQHLSLGANFITDATPVLRCPRLLHAGLGYNRIESLTTADVADATLARHQLMSLDLSHNDLVDLPGTVGALSRLPSLAMLSLRGNPLSLLPDYRKRVLKGIPRLAVLDGLPADGAGGADGVATAGFAMVVAARMQAKKGTSGDGGLPKIDSSITDFLSVHVPEMGVRCKLSEFRPSEGDVRARAPRGASHAEVWAVVENPLDPGGAPLGRPVRTQKAW